MWTKPQESVTARKNLTDFSAYEPVAVRKEEAFLSDDVSIIIAHNKKKNERMDIVSLLSFTNINVLPFADEIPVEVDHNSYLADALFVQRKIAMKRSMVFITGDCHGNFERLLGLGLYKPDTLTDYFEEIRQNVKFKKWFFGHYHDNRNVNAEEILLWEQIIRMA